MKKRVFMCALGIMPFIANAQNQDSIRAVTLQSVGIKALKAASDAPFTKVDISANQLKVFNTAQDLPMLLQYQVGVQSFSDAGNGVGYTGLRIRGNDITRINVTLNGVPVNDPESQATFFVNLPDLASSASSIQIQRGVGSSSNGPGAFGASINVNTLPNNFSKKRLSISADGGSLQTGKLTLMGNTGSQGKWNSSFRLSGLSSEGYVRNSFSRLVGGQYYLSYQKNKNTSFAFNYLGGKEKTGLAWDGVPISIIDSNRRYNGLGIKEDGTYFRDQTDNYQQHYFQFFYNKIVKQWQFNVTPYYTRGLGYYQEYKTDQTFADYQIPQNLTDTFTNGSIIRQLWLNNHLLGTYANATRNFNKSQLTLSVHANQYFGKHYGLTPFIQHSIAKFTKRWYDLRSAKTDASAFIKYNWHPTPKWNLFADMQYRNVQYKIDGFRNNPTLKKDLQWEFLNPKIGVSHNFINTKNRISQAYTSLAIANKEPNREDLENGTAPLPERMLNAELGYSFRVPKFQLATNVYLMQYKNQLVLTGKVNDVGAYTRTNVDQSYRIGWETEMAYKLNSKITFNANAALTDNRIKNFTEYIYNWDTNLEEAIDYTNTSIAFSPNLMVGYGANATVLQRMKQNIKVNLFAKYVSRQYLDNTSSFIRSIPGYHNMDLLLSSNISKYNEATSVRFGIYNLTNAMFESNGYAFSDISGGVRNNYINVFPQAGRRIMLGFTYILE